MQPKLLIKIGDDDEFDIAERVPGLTYLGDDANLATTNQLSQFGSLDGSIYQYKTFNSYQVPAKFLLQFDDWYDYKLAKHEINQIFGTRKIMRIRTDAEMAIVRFVLPTFPEIAPALENAHWATFTENFDNPSGYRYSIARSDRYTTLATDELQLGMNFYKYLVNEENMPSYTFTTTSFRVLNPSDIPIEPYTQKHDLRILIKFKGDSLTISNKTTGDIYTYKKPSDGSEQIIIDGITTTLNGKPASGNTDYGDLSLTTGWNEFTTSGASSLNITFSFPFIYL